MKENQIPDGVANRRTYGTKNRNGYRVAKPQVVVLTLDELGDIVEQTTTWALERALDKVSADMERVLEQLDVARGIYNQQQACAFFRCNEDTLRRYRRMGLKYYRVGHRPFYLLEDIEAFIRQHPASDVCTAPASS